MRFLGFLVTFLVFSGLANADERYSSAVHGFTISPPVLAGMEDSLGLVATFFLPSERSFAPNINILKSKWDKSLAEYKQRSLDDFKKLNIRPFNVVDGDGYFILESEVTQKGIHMYWYQAIWLKDGTSYVVTATCLWSQKDRQGRQLRESVNSFRPL